MSKWKTKAIVVLTGLAFGMLLTRCVVDVLTR